MFLLTLQLDLLLLCLYSHRSFVDVLIICAFSTTTFHLLYVLVYFRLTNFYKLTTERTERMGS